RAAPPFTGFGTGFTRNVWYPYSTRNDRKIAMMTRRACESISVRSGEGSGPVDVRGRTVRYQVEPRGTQWMAASESSHRQPTAAYQPEALNGLRSVIGARRQEPTGPSKIW